MPNRDDQLLENLILTDIDEDAVGEDTGTLYNYYGFSRPDNTWVIMRENVAGTEYRYAAGNGLHDNTYDINWTNRTTIDYKPGYDFKP